MKVSQIQQIQSVQKYRSNQERTSNAIKRKEDKEEKVEISQEAKELLQHAKGNLERMNKLQQLKQEIASGTYEVDVNKLAEKLLPHLLKDLNDDRK